MAKLKVTEKQLSYLRSLYRGQGKELTPSVEIWLANLPREEASDYIDKWRTKVAERRVNRKKWWGNARASAIENPLDDDLSDRLADPKQ